MEETLKIMFQAQFNLVLNTARTGMSTTSLGNLFQGLTTLNKELLPNIYSKPALCQFEAISIIISLHALARCPRPAFL